MIAALEGRVGRVWMLVVAVSAAMLLAVGAPAAARADGPTGSIAGTVSAPSAENPTGSLSEIVTVSLYRLDGSTWTYVSNFPTNGEYSFDSLPVGSYTISVTADAGSSLAGTWWGGPTKASAQPIVVAASKNVNASVKLNYAGTLAGTVSTSTGDAIIGALVSVSFVSGTSSFKVADVETDPFGGYSLAGLNPGTYTLLFSASVGASTPTTTKTSVVKAGETTAVDVSFAVPVDVQGSVQDSDGKVVPGAKVTLTKSGDASPKATATASATGTFSFSHVGAGSYVLGASFNSSSSQHTFSFADGSDASITLTIPRRGALTGTIRDADGTVVPGAAVSVWRVNGSKAATATAAADGTFRVIGLADGSYTVSAGIVASTPLVYLGGARALRAAQFRAVTAGASVALGTIAFPSGASATGSVTAGGNPVSGAAVTLYFASGGVAAHATTAVDGTYTAVGLAPGDYLVAVAAPSGSGLASADAGAAKVTVVGSTPVVVAAIELVAGGGASGSVATVALTPVVDATVGVFQRTSAGGLTHIADVTTSATGTFTASELRPGSYTFSVTPTGSSSTTWIGGTASGSTASTVTIAAGPATPVGRILLPFAPGGVRGTIVAPNATATDRAAAKVVLQSKTGAAVTMTVAPTATGAFSFTGVPDGDYTIVVTGLAGYADTWSGAAARQSDAAVLAVRGGSTPTANITAIPAVASASGWLDADEPLPDDATVTALRKFADGTTAAAGVTAAVENWGYDIRGLVVGATYVMRIDAGRPQPEYWVSAAGDDTFTATEAGTALDDYWLVSRGALHGTAHDGGGSTPVDGTRVTLFSGSTAVADTTIDGGAYSFQGLLPGSYSVRFGDPDDGAALFASIYSGGSADPTTAPAFAVSGGGDTDAGAAALPRARSLAGTASAAIAESGGDHVALAGTTVSLAVGDHVVARTTSDAVGGYAFAVAPGAYTVCISAPAAGAYSGLGLTAGCWNGSVDTSAAVGTQITVARTDVAGISIRLATPTALQSLAAGTPVLSGTAAVGYALAVAPGTWTPGTTLAYQWYADGAPIAGATTSGMVPSASLAGRALSVRVTGSKPGYTSAVKVTGTSLRVLAWGTVAVSGSAAVGYRLTAVAGTWTSGTAFRYQWYANGVAIKGATASAFTVTKTQAAKSLSVRITGVKSGYTTVTRASAGTPKAIVVGAVKISDTTPARKQKITVKAGTWTSGTRIAYQWYLNGVAIKGATKSSLTVSSSWKGKKLSVRVTGSKSGYTTVAVTKATSAVH
jgi:hypothetical protein